MLEKKAALKEKKSGTNFNEYGYNLFSRIQILFFSISLLLIPILLFPLEWVMFEYARVFILVFFTIVLLTFELIKFFIKGRLEIYKSPRDQILFLLGLSFFVSLVFSSDFLVSFWGYEYRFGTGFISILSMLIYLMVLKSVVKDFKTLVSLLSYLTIGILISAILSIFSFYGMNPFGFISGFDKFFFVGLSLFNSAKLSIAVWSLGLILASFIFYYFFKIFSNDEAYLDRKLSLANAYRKKRIIQISLLVAFSLISFILISAIALFSIKNAFWFGIFSLVGVSLILLFVTFLAGRRIFKFMSVILILLSAMILGITKLPETQKIFSINPDKVVEQVSLENADIWAITISSLSESVGRGFVGLGNDNFVVAYNQYRPAFSGDIDLNFVNYSYANNEIYNIVANRGLLGLFIWLVVGFLLFKQFIQYLGDESRKQLLKPDSLEHVAILFLDLLLLFLWFCAFFTYYSFILYFLFLLIIVVSSLFKNISYKMHCESLVVQTNFFVEKIGQVKTDSLPKIFIFLVFIGSVFSLYLILNDFTSRVYAVKAETIFNEIDAYGDAREEKYKEMLGYYEEAILRNPNNYVLNRRVSLILADYINKILVKNYSDLSDENERQEYIRVVGLYGEAAIDESKKATDLAPMVALNWSVRDLVYSDLVRIGFHNYMNTAVKVSEQSILRNPNNYGSYISKATYLYLSGDMGGSITFVRQALEINPYNVSALVLGGEVSMSLQDYVNAKTYFENAKMLLEELDLTQPQVFNLYEQVKKSLDYIWSLELEDSASPDEEIGD